jgi:adenylyltransferase/sulfurtransferase
MSDIVHIDPQDRGNRFARFELISWWDQARLAAAKVLVIGAGALGNEIIKNLALLGVGNVFVADLDRIEASNLSRSVLYRERDCGRSKAEAAAQGARDIYPHMRLQPFDGNIVYELGLGVYRWADVILGGLDNREARVAINRAAAKVGKPWIDGAIERLDGVARVFDPAIGPCYECTMSDIDWKMLAARRSCALLSRSEIEQGKTPTTPTTSSVIAGIQVQEAVKMLHGLDTLSGQGFVFDGTNHQSYVVQYTRLEDCPSHDAMGGIVELPWKVSETRVGDLLDRVRSDLGPTAVVELNQELMSGLRCGGCGESRPLLASLARVTEADARCSHCGEVMAPVIYHTLGDSLSLMDKTLAELGIPRWEIVAARAGDRQQAYEFAGDRQYLLGTLYESEN